MFGSTSAVGAAAEGLPKVPPAVRGHFPGGEGACSAAPRQSELLPRCCRKCPRPSGGTSPAARGHVRQHLGSRSCCRGAAESAPGRRGALPRRRGGMFGSTSAVGAAAEVLPKVPPAVGGHFPGGE